VVSDSMMLERPPIRTSFQTRVLKSSGRIFVIFLPVTIGLLWLEEPGLSITWSLIGSVAIAVIAQTRWFRQPGDRIAITARLLRPQSMFHLLFVAYHIVGGAAYALDSAGYSMLTSGTTLSIHIDLTTIAECQRLMLLAHASVTVGMKLVGFRYSNPRYVIAAVPGYALLAVSLLASLSGNFFLSFESFRHFGYKLLDISAAALLVEIAFSIRYKRRSNLIMAVALLGLTLVNQAVSGWKGLTLWTMITLCALLYPLMSKRIIVIGAAFAIFWALFLHPFGLALRPLLWYQGVDRDKAVEISMDKALNMSMDERLSGVWTMMVSRANDLSQFGKYVKYVPERHDYYGSDLAEEAMVALVPRVIWPSKPDLEKVAMKRVYDAGVVSRESIVSAKSNFFQDSYLSGGLFGVFVSSLIFGVLAMLLSRMCETLFGGYEIGTCFVFTGLFATTINVPPSFMFFVGAVWTSIIVVLSLFALGRLMGWIVPAGHELPQARKRAHPLSFAGSSHVAQLRR
jgi:hypothetical protein